MDPEYAGAYRDLFERHWWWRSRNRMILGQVSRLEPIGGWGRILDVGCGDALLFEELSAFGTVHGVEADASLITEQRWRERIHVGQFDASLEIEPGFSLILMLDVLEHMVDPVKALAYARELLSPCGRLLLTVPAMPALWTRHDELNQHARRYTRDLLLRHCMGGGLRLEESWHFFHWTVPLKLLVRALESVGFRGASTPQVPPPWLNYPLYMVSSLEHQVSQALPVPFGSSLFAVARAPF